VNSNPPGEPPSTPPAEPAVDEGVETPEPVVEQTSGITSEEFERREAELTAARRASVMPQGNATAQGVDLGISQQEYSLMSGREKAALRRNTPGTFAYNRANGIDQ
jgi:hypothetical protein